MLYCGLKNVKFPQESYVTGKFQTFTSTSTNRNMACTFRGSKGVILEMNHEFIDTIPNCDVSWLSIYPEEQELVFTRGLGPSYRPLQIKKS